MGVGGDCMRRFVPIIVIISLAFTVSCSPEASTDRRARVKPMAAGEVSLPEAQDFPEDNSLCILCHMDFDFEEITARHAEAGITCAHCHGESVAHMHDETLMTSPDILYGRSEVEGMCGHCHSGHSQPTVVQAFLDEWRGRKRENGRGINEESICTDCHGLHTVARR